VALIVVAVLLFSIRTVDVAYRRRAERARAREIREKMEPYRRPDD